MTDIRQQISEQLSSYQNLGALKAAIEDWLASDGSFSALQQALQAHRDRYRWGEIDEHLQFVPLSDPEMVAKSLEALADYRRTGKGLTQQQIEQKWMTRLGSEF
jgi:hypothetical protein